MTAVDAQALAETVRVVIPKPTSMGTCLYPILTLQEADEALAALDGLVEALGQHEVAFAAIEERFDSYPPESAEARRGDNLARRAAEMASIAHLARTNPEAFGPPVPVRGDEQ